MRYLFISEKESAMKEVQKVYDHSSKPLGDIDFVKLSGHVCKLSEPKAYDQWNVRWADRKLPMVPQTFRVEPIREDIIKEIKKKLKETHYDAIIVGTDSDVEGNGIYDLLETYLGLQDIPAYRFFESSLTPQAIMHSMETLTDYHTNPRDVRMTQSYRIRSRFDWLIGFNLSVAYTVRSGFLMKVGRVKAPTLKLVYDNCKAIDAFRQTTAYQPMIETSGFSAGLVDESNKAIAFPKREDAQAVIDSLTGNATVLQAKKDMKKTAPQQFYKLTDAQYEAGQKYGYSPAQTLELIQSLYEKKLLSYPRTDGRYVSTEKAREFPAILKSLAKVDSIRDIAARVSDADIRAVQNDKRYVDDAEVEMASHDALLPTGDMSALSGLSRQENNVFEMACRRFLAAFLPPLMEEKRSILLEDNGNRFLKNGSCVMDPGFTVLYSKPAETILPDVREGDALKEDGNSIHEAVSRPPTRFTQATLLKAMENIQKYIKEKDLKDAMKRAKGIGQPSSRAEIISDLIRTGYIQDVAKKGLVITDAGKQYIENLGNCSIVSPTLSAAWEIYMGDIREGRDTYEAVYEKILDYLGQALDELSHVQIQKKEREEVGKCPVCGKPVVALPKGYGCSGYPDCKFSFLKKISGKILSEKNVSDLLTKGTTGMLEGFISKKTGNPFPGELVIKDGQVAWAPFETPTGLVCPKCGKGLVKTSMSYKCPDRDCGFIIWKASGYMLSEEEASQLIRDGQTDVIDKFVSKEGKPFSAKIVLMDGKQGLVFPGDENAKETGYVCPACGKHLYKTDRAYKCMTPKCRTQIGISPCGHTLTDKEINDLLTKGRTEKIGDFVSKKGKQFASEMVMKNGQAVFDFPDSDNTEKKGWKGSGKWKGKRK